VRCIHHTYGCSVVTLCCTAAVLLLYRCCIAAVFLLHCCCCCCACWSAEFVAAMSQLATEWGWRGSGVPPDSPYVVRQSKNNRWVCASMAALSSESLVGNYCHCNYPCITPVGDATHVVRQSVNNRWLCRCCFLAQPHICMWCASPEAAVGSPRRRGASGGLTVLLPCTAFQPHHVGVMVPTHRLPWLHSCLDRAATSCSSCVIPAGPCKLPHPLCAVCPVPSTFGIPSSKHMCVW
jgi:hypothetical protein